MERCQQMDTPGVASIRRQIKPDRISRPGLTGLDACARARLLRKWREIAILFILAFSALPLRAQPSLSDHTTEIKQLFAEERWEEVVRIAELEAERSADLNFYYGTALARLGRLNEARKAFQTGFSQQPGDKRFS